VNAPPSTRSRVFSLDALRGLAVFLMIEQHVGIWLWRGPDRGHAIGDYPFLVGFNALGGMAAPLFVTLAGVGSAFFVAAGRPRTDLTLVRRGLVLMGFGLVLNLLTPSWFSWGSWFVLHMMGFAMALTPVWRRLSDRTLLLVCLGVLVSAVAVQVWLRTPLVLHNPRMRDVSLPGGPFRLALAEGQSPILPWLTFYLAGFVAGRFIHAGQPKRVAWLGLGFAAIGLVGLAAYRAGLVHHPWLVRAFSLQLGFFPASTAIVGLLLGGALLLIAGGAWIETKRPISPAHPMVTLGRISLTLLMLHVVVFRELSRPVDLWRGLSAPATLAVVFGFLLLATLVSRLWMRVDYRGGAEWLLRKLAG
jgi:uncharacterized membrane protein